MLFSLRTLWSGLPGFRTQWKTYHRAWWVLIVIATVLMVCFFAFDIVFSPFAVLFSLLLLLPVLLLLLALLLRADRYRPRPPQLTIAILLLAAGGIGSIASIANEIVFEVLATSRPEERAELLTMVFGAPIIEEVGKAALLLALFYGLRGVVLDLQDALVYAVLIGLGFSFTEDLYYISSASNVGEMIGTFVLRSLLTSMSHSLFIAIFAIALGLSLRRPLPLAARGALLLSGLCLAIAVHMLWNYASSSETDASLIIYPLIYLPLLALVIVLFSRSLCKERRTLCQGLGAARAAGLVGDSEYALLTAATRRAVRQEALRQGGETLMLLQRYERAAYELARYLQCGPRPYRLGPAGLEQAQERYRRARAQLIVQVPGFAQTHLLGA